VARAIGMKRPDSSGRFIHYSWVRNPGVRLKAFSNSESRDGPYFPEKKLNVGYGFWPLILRIETTALHEEHLRECRLPQLFKEDLRIV